MTMKLDKQVVAQIWGGSDTLLEAIKEFQRAKIRHAKTVNVPAPTAHPIVEEIVTYFGGNFEVVDGEQEPVDDIGVPVQPEQPPPVLTLPQMKEQLLARLEERRDQRLYEGVKHKGHRYNGLGRSTEMMRTLLTTTAPVLTRWRDADGNWADLDRDDIQSIMLAVRAIIPGAMNNEYLLAQKIIGAPTEGALKLININTGWPPL